MDINEINLQDNGQEQTASINYGTVAIESMRAVSEAKSKLLIAQEFPRDEIKAFARVIEACKRKSFAEQAFFSYPRAGQTVTGVTIKFAQELARCWGHIDYGIKELSQDADKSEMQAYAWDTETNTISTQNFVVPHIREVRDNKTKMLVSKPLTSYRDIYENNANMGARRLRSRILAILPCDLVEAAINTCKETLNGESDVPLVDRIKKMVVLFQKFGVTQEQIEERLGRGIETMTKDDLIEYGGIYNSISAGETKIIEWFGAVRESASLNDLIKSETGGSGE